MAFLTIDVNDILKGAITASTNAIAVYLSMRFIGGGIIDKIAGGKTRGARTGNGKTVKKKHKRNNPEEDKAVVN